jgi:large subunit ribosomal protein L5e
VRAEDALLVEVGVVLNLLTLAGLHIPHSTKRFPGAKAGEGKEVEYDADFHKERIFGAHVQEYMETMKDEDEQGYQKLYSGYIAAGVEPDDMEEMYTEAHKKIR